MGKREIVTGTLIDDRTVALDSPVPLLSTKVRVSIEPLEPSHRQLYRAEVVAKIYASQAARGHRPPTRAEVDRRIQGERDSWGD